MNRENAIKMLEYLATETTGTLAGEQGDYAEFLVRVIDSLDMAIAALKEQPQWISVEDRLPEPDTDVLARRCSGMDVECYHKESGGYWSWDTYAGGSVTHWMPLPEPPEVEV